MFKIEASELCWVKDDEDDPNDLCLHGYVVVHMGNEVIKSGCTVSATALYLLKSLYKDHIIHKEGIQLLPCCGHFWIPYNDAKAVEIFGCCNGVDWSVLHEGNDVKLVTESGVETRISFADYKKTVTEFADSIKDYYDSCAPKVVPDESLDGYHAFWYEWNELRHRV